MSKEKVKMKRVLHIKECIRLRCQTFVCQSKIISKSNKNKNEYFDRLLRTKNNRLELTFNINKDFEENL